MQGCRRSATSAQSRRALKRPARCGLKKCLAGGVARSLHRPCNGVSERDTLLGATTVTRSSASCPVGRGPGDRQRGLPPPALTSIRRRRQAANFMGRSPGTARGVLFGDPARSPSSPPRDLLRTEPLESISFRAHSGSVCGGPDMPQAGPIAGPIEGKTVPKLRFDVLKPQAGSAETVQPRLRWKVHPRLVP